jgi:methyl-accepting chemotaxis protein
MLLSVQRIPDSDWLIGLATHRDAILAPLNTLLLSVAGLSVLVFALLIPLASVLLGRMLGGLVALKNAMQDIAHGEGDLTLRLQLQGRTKLQPPPRRSTSLSATWPSCFVACATMPAGWCKG